jgi:Zincin-like metallopeptidase
VTRGGAHLGTGRPSVGPRWRSSASCFRPWRTLAATFLYGSLRASGFRLTLVAEPGFDRLWVCRRGLATRSLSSVAMHPRSEAADFEQGVEDALEALPADLRRFMSNVAIVVEQEPPAGMPLLGLYQGLPLTKRGAGYTGVVPDKITISGVHSSVSTAPIPVACVVRSGELSCTRSRTTSASATTA